MAAKRPPPMEAPSSEVTVKVSAIDSTLLLHGIKCSSLFEPSIKGFERFKAGTWSLLIEHPSGKKLLYDLGCRKDWENLPPAINLEHWLNTGVLQELRIEKDVAEILVDGGVALTDVDGVIWSHFHFDHTGAVSTFPKSTKLIVGQGTKANFIPGYPTDPAAQTLDSDFEGREVFEVDFQSSNLQIGGFGAFDYFGDGSFYLVDGPGHAVGHVHALARTYASPHAGFIHLCGDTVHHAAQMRPTEYLPLPDVITPSPVPSIHPGTCPGHFFEPLLRDGRNDQHILGSVDHTAGLDVERKFAGIYDFPALKASITKTEELDADADVFTISAHDWSLKGVIPEWPEDLNSWRERGWKESTRWNFLGDFEEGCKV